MAKKKQTKKKGFVIAKPVQYRFCALTVLFLAIVAAFRLGYAGQAMDSFFQTVTGFFSRVFYVLVSLTCLYILYKGKLPRFTGPRAVGIYLISLAVLIAGSAPADPKITGMAVFAQTRTGGYIGAALFAGLSALFGRLGALLLAAFAGIGGLCLFIGKVYFDLARSKLKKGRETISQNIQERRQKPPEKKAAIFPDRVFDDEQPEEKPSYQPVKETKVKKETKKITKEKAEPPDIEATFMEPAPVPSGHYQLPPASLLDANRLDQKTVAENNRIAREKGQRLAQVLNEFGVHAAVSDIHVGPAVTKYELKLETGTRVNRIAALQDDIKLALAARDIRVEAPIPGKSAVGVEIPNETMATVSFREVLMDIPASKKDSKLLVPLGKDVMGQTVFAELDKMPHLLIAGTTGSGKSVCVNVMICSLLMRATPQEVRLVLVDPKKVELSNYNGIPHLLSPVITDPKKAAKALQAVVAEMERRYELFAQYNARNIAGYNESARLVNENSDEHREILPLIVVILDEVADLMMVASKDVEDCIMRISQMARAAGIHLIVATQRPSTDVITGVVKANIPSRIAFAVSSAIDSRTILDMSGAEKLLGKGDMLYSPMGSGAPVRVQGAYVSDREVAAIVQYVSAQKTAEYDEQFLNLESAGSDHALEDTDEEYEECRDFVIRAQKASASLLQRQFRIGYNKAARIIDQLEANGVIGPQIGSKPREVYIRQYEEENL